MPILRLDKNGIPYETDSRFDGERGMGRTPGAVEDGTLQLDLNEDKKVLKDRAALKNLQTQDAINKFRKYAFDKTLHEEKEKIRKKQEEKLYLVKQKMSQLENNRKSMNYMKALQQSGVQKEVNSGVDGYGLTSDGRRPYMDMPALDYAPEVSVEEAFGELPSGIDLSGMGTCVMMGATGMPDGNPVYTIPTLSNFVDPITLADANILGPFSTKDQYLIDAYESDILNMPYQVEYKPNPPYTVVRMMDVDTKKLIDNRSEMASNPKARYEAAARGWMYSGWHDSEGNFISVKVPFAFGIPMDFANATTVDEKAARDRYRNDPFFSSQTQSVFDWLKPVISAYARKYLYEKTDKEQADKTLQYETSQPKVTAEVFKAEQAVAAVQTSVLRQAYNEIMEKIFSGAITRQEAKKSGVFNHPMATYKLIK